MKKRSDHFGAHLSPNGLWFLLQDTPEQNVRSLNIKSGIEVRPYRSSSCPHALVLQVSGELSDDGRAFLRTIERDPVGRLLLPRPDNAGQIIFISSEDVDSYQIQESLALGSPVVLPMRYAWMTNEADIKRESRLTNLQPFVVLDVDMKWMKNVGYKAIGMFRLGTRPLILVGNRDVVLPSEVKRRRGTIFKKIAKSGLPLKEMGAHYLNTWMRDH